MPMPSNSVFISYRRNASGYAARAVFDDLTAHGIDTFLDIESIDSGQFETIILNQIAARPYFLVILGPGCLERCAEPGDWLRREIERAINLDRMIVPLLTSAFDFNAAYAKPYLAGQLAKLPSYNAVNVPLDYFEAAMDRLRTRFLKTDLPTTPAPPGEWAAVQQKIEQAKAKPTVTPKQLNAQDYVERGLARPADALDNKIADYSEAIRLDPKDKLAYNNRGWTRGSAGDKVGAMADYTEAIRVAPQYAAAYYGRAVARIGKDFDGAIADCTEAIRLDPKFAKAYSWRGFMRFKKQGFWGNHLDLDGAIADCTEAIRLDPKFADPYFYRGLAFDAKGNGQQAAADYQQVLALEPKHPQAQVMREYIAQHGK